ncbi:MAG: hypothetical protein ACTSRH_14140 [Promethearchaeota archaeon]
MKQYIGLNIGKLVVKQIKAFFYERTFDDLTLGNYKILQAKLNVIGKDINKLKTRFFEIKVSISLTLFNCSQCGATLNIISREEKFIIYEHCDTPFLLKWKKNETL